MQLLRTARDAYRPRLVAEVPLELAFDGHRRVGREFEVAVRVEPLDGLEHAEICHLQEIVEGFAAVRVAPREMRGERLVRLDQLVA